MSGPQRPSVDGDARTNKGLIFVLAGPAGSGKTALMDRLREREPNVYFCVTATTRAPRPGEQEGIDYFFLEEQEFLARIDRGEFLEHARVPPGHGRLYGSPCEPVFAAIEDGRDVFLQVDVQGAQSIRSRIPEAITIFLKPPNPETLRQRLAKRGTETDEDVERRLANALVELARESEFDHSVINADGGLDAAVADVQAVMSRARSKAAKRAADPTLPHA